MSTGHRWGTVARERNPGSSVAAELQEALREWRALAESVTRSGGPRSSRCCNGAVASWPRGWPTSSAAPWTSSIRPPVSPSRSRRDLAHPRRRPASRPWATGLPSPGSARALIAFADIALGRAFAEAFGLLWVPANLFVGLGLAPSISCCAGCGSGAGRRSARRRACWWPGSCCCWGCWAEPVSGLRGSQRWPRTPRSTSSQDGITGLPFLVRRFVVPAARAPPSRWPRGRRGRVRRRLGGPRARPVPLPGPRVNGRRLPCVLRPRGLVAGRRLESRWPRVALAGGCPLGRPLRLGRGSACR